MTFNNEDDHTPSRLEPIAKALTALVGEFGLCSLSVTVFSTNAHLSGLDGGTPPGTVRIMAGVPFGGKVLGVQGQAQDAQLAVAIFRREVEGLHQTLTKSVELLRSV